MDKRGERNGLIEEVVVGAKSRDRTDWRVKSSMEVFVSLQTKSSDEIERE